MKSLRLFLIFLFLASSFLIVAQEEKVAPLPLPSNMQGVPDQEIFFPLWENLKTGQWVTYTQGVSGRSWELEYTLKVLEVAGNDYYILEATTVRPYETIIQKWKVSLANGKILDYWISIPEREPQRLPILFGANNTELIKIENGIAEKASKGKGLKFYDITTPAGAFKCWRVVGKTSNEKPASSFLNEKIPFFQIVSQKSENVTIQLKAYSQ